MFSGGTIWLSTVGLGDFEKNTCSILNQGENNKLHILHRFSTGKIIWLVYQYVLNVTFR